MKGVGLYGDQGRAGLAREDVGERRCGDLYERDACLSERAQGVFPGGTHTLVQVIKVHAAGYSQSEMTHRLGPVGNGLTAQHLVDGDGLVDVARDRAHGVQTAR